MKLKTSEAEGEVLNYLVAKCEEYFDIGMASVHEGVTDVFYFSRWQPSTDWSQAGPIIERDKICISTDAFNTWMAWVYDGLEMVGIEHGPTPLVAAMRCYVASKLGDEVEVPDEIVS